MKRSKYRILSHTADLRLEVHGETLEDLFENSAEALNDILSPKHKKTQGAKKLLEKIKIKAPNLNALLVDFLNEILSRSHINKQVYKVKSLRLKEVILESELIGYKINEFDEDIKAITYHEVDIRQEDGIWQTKLVFDI